MTSAPAILRQSRALPRTQKRKDERDEAPRRVVADAAKVAVAATKRIQTECRVDCVIGVGAAAATHDDLAEVQVAVF